MKSMDEKILEELQRALDQYRDAKEHKWSVDSELEYFVNAREFAEAVTGRRIIKKGWTVSFADQLI